MKLVVAIVQDNDAAKLRQELTRQGFKSTKLSSTGGFLREGNTTFLIGVEDEAVWHVKALIHKVCKERTKLAPSNPYFNGGESMYAEPVEVQVGGAVVFVLALDEMARL